VRPRTLARGRLNQGPVEPVWSRGHGHGDATAALRRFGGYKGFEGRCERLLGKECLEAVLHSSLGVKHPTQVMGLPAVVYDGWLVPQFSGGAGFTSLSDLISEATTGGKRQIFRVNKTGSTQPAAGSSAHLWNQNTLPPNGTNAAAAPGGSVFDNTTTGALGQANAAGGDTLHFVSAMPVCVSPCAILMYDFIFGVSAPVTSGSLAVTGVPTRYATTTSPGNWISANVTTAYAVTAHNVTITYMDQAGNTAEAGTAQAGRVSSAINTIPMTGPQWTYSLNAGDTGARKITNINFSATSASAVASWYIGHSIVTMPCPVANLVVPVDGINSAFNLVQILDGAALAFMEFMKTQTTANTVQIEDLILVSG
jgi:hypothetical protein